MCRIGAVCTLLNRSGGYSDYLNIPIRAPNDLIWAININNTNAFALTNASISNVSITQTAGAAATPVILTTLPISLGTIPANSTAIGDLAIDFSSASSNSLWDLKANFNADDLTASLFFANLPIQIVEVNGFQFFGPYPGTVTITSPTPLPAALPLFATSLGALGMLGWRRKRKASLNRHLLDIPHSHNGVFADAVPC
jgi:hypothetical protein